MLLKTTNANTPQSSPNAGPTGKLRKNGTKTGKIVIKYEKGRFIRPEKGPEGGADAVEEPKYTGLNRFFQSDAIQAIIKHMTDGTLSEFIGDWKWIFSFTKKYRWIVIFYTVMGIVGSTLSLGSSYVGRILINIVVGQEREQLWVLICAMLGMTLFSLALSSVSSRIFTRISIYVNNDIQGEIFDRIMDARWAELSAIPAAICSTALTATWAPLPPTPSTGSPT